MKHLLTILCILTSFSALAQFPNTHTQSNPYTKEIFNGSVNPKKGVINGRYSDTAAANRDYVAGEKGIQIVVGNTIYMRDSTATKWIFAGGYGVTASNITILNDSSISVCNTNSCDTFKFTNIVVNNFTVVNDSTILVCDGNNTCDTLSIPPTPIAKPYVDSAKIIGGTLYYYINGNAYPSGDVLGRTDGLISPGIVTWAHDTTFFVSSATYIINGKQYISPSDSVTISGIDPSLPTKFLFIVDTLSRATYLRGVPATIPLDPQVDPSSQIALTSGITFDAGATQPENINQITIYDEYLGAPDEWAVSSTGTISVNFSSTTTPYHLTKDINVSSFNKNSALSFLGASNETVLDGEILRFFINLKAPFTGSKGLRIQFFNGSTAASNAVSIYNTFGLNPSILNSYQNVSIPLNAFIWSSQTFNKIVVTNVNSGTGYLLDYVQLQTGINNIPSQTDYSNKLDSVFLSNDSLFQYVKGVKTFRGLATGSGSGSDSSAYSSAASVNDSTWSLNAKNGTKTFFQLTQGTTGIVGDTVKFTNPNFVKKSDRFPIGTIKPILAPNDSTLAFDSLNLTELRYSLASRDTTTWTDTTLIDKGYLNDRIAGISGGTTTDTSHLSDRIDANAANIATNTTAIGTKLNSSALNGGTTNQVLTKNSGTDQDYTWKDPTGGGGSSLWTQNTDSSIYYKKAPVLIGTDVNDGHTLRVNGSVSFNLGSDSTGDLLYRNSTGGLTPIRTGTTKQTLHPDGLGGYVWKDSATAGGSATWGGITGTLSSQTDLQAALNSKWSLTGNSGTTAGTNFLGTTDNANLVFKRNSVQSGLIDSSGTTKSTTFGFGTGISNAQTITAFGYKALAVNTGVNNSAFGANALIVNTTGTNNSAFGINTLTANVSGTYNTAIGQGVLAALSSGNYNTVVGANAAIALNGSYNTGVGTATIQNNTGSGNSAIGYGVLRNGSGSSNVGIGREALGSATVDGSNNTALGYQAGYANTTGSNNVYIGYQAGNFNSTASNQLFIGSNSGFGVDYLSQQNLSIIWGQTATISQSYLTNQLLSLNGRIGINNPSPTSYLHLARGTAGAGTSPLKFRKPISINVTGASGTGTTATITFATQSTEIFTRGSYVTISGISPSGYNGTWQISNVTTNHISFSCTETGTYVSGGVINQGSFMTTPESGAEEFDGANLAITDSTNTRYLLAKTLTTTATLDFASTAAQTSSELTITLTGAADGDIVLLGIPNASSNANSTFTARVSAANTISVKFNNYSSAAIDPASGTFRVSILKY